MLAAVVGIAADQFARVLADQERRVGPVADKLVVPQLLLEDDVEPCERNGAVGAGVGLQPDVGSGGAVDAGRVDVDVLGGLVLVHVDAAAHGAPQRAFGGVCLRPALAPVDDRASRVGRDGHDGLDGPADHGHVERVVPAPADGAGVDDVAGVAEQVEEARARPQVVGAVGSLGGEQSLRAVFLLQGEQLGGNLVDRLLPGNLLPAVLALLADALHGVVDALRMVVELDGLLALLAEAIAYDAALVLVGAHLDQASGLGVHAAPDAAVHVAHEATGPAPADAVFVNGVVGHALHGNRLAHG